MNDLTQYIKRAFEYKNEGCYKEAIDYFYKALTVDNDSSEIMNELAVLYSKLNQNDRAISFCEQILAKNPNDFDVRFFMACLYKKLKNYQKAKENLFMLFDDKEHLQKAAEELFSVLLKVKDYNKLIEIYHANKDELKSSAIYCYVGSAYLALNDKSVAEAFYKKSFEIDSKNVESGSRVAEILFENEAYDEAEKLLKHLLNYSENDRIYYLLAELYYLKSDIDNVINYYVLAIQLNDKNALYYYKLGSAYMIKGFINLAEENYLRARELETSNFLYNYTLAYFYYFKGEISNAKYVLEPILDMDKENVDAYALRLLIALDEDDVEKAEELLQSIKKIGNYSEIVCYAQSLYYAKLSLWSKAIEWIKKAVSFNQKSCEYKYELAKYYCENKKYKEAKSVCKEIIELNDKYINAYILSAKINLELKDYNEVINDVNLALKLDMNIPEIYYIKGIVENIKNEKTKAIESFKTAISMSPQKIEYYEAAAKCMYEIEDYESAYRYYKEVADFDVTNGEYRYYMAKCAENRNDLETAITNYSIAKRLSPVNIQYVEDYAKALVKANKKKRAINAVKSSMKLCSGAEKARLKQIINKL